jgi:hypothetical protein
MEHMKDAKASDMAGTCKVFSLEKKRHMGKGKAKVDLPLNEVKEGRTHKPELGMTGKPTVTHTMKRDFGRAHEGKK